MREIQHDDNSELAGIQFEQLHLIHRGVGRTSPDLRPPCLILMKIYLSGKCSYQCTTSPDQDSAGVTKKSWSQFMSQINLPSSHLTICHDFARTLTLLGLILIFHYAAAWLYFFVLSLLNFTVLLKWSRGMHLLSYFSFSFEFHLRKKHLMKIV